ncbi:PAS-domain containing protein [Pseudoxanthomonas sp. SE1]|uniref:hybrid sensor histidine kinase/response regulator n=1 Tax=Pseudoxanthomonas sp. SE1 TaxID=1664560 RepID=UPI00240DEC3A|nr:PAS-domain containing protein [Pseudoxanthomonas sp. SE1]WFC43810.1 PAS-domain containing protein [Pseudoxanthomonas sp. SE1]
MRARRHRRILLVLLSILGGALLVMALAYHWAGTRAQRAETAQLDRQLDLHAQALQQRIDRYRTLPQVLAQDPDLRDALAGPVDDARRNALNQRLEDANSVTRSSTLTLIDRRGIALAASNWREPTSNVGEDYSFRPYVKQALRNGRGQFYGIGLTTGEPGYFLSQAIDGPAGDVAGLVVIKIELDALEQEWLQTPDIVLVSDAHGVIFLASRDGWRYRTLTALSDADRRELAATRQYARQRLTPLQSQDLSTPDDGARRVQFTDPALAGTVLWQSMSLPGEGWQLHLLHDASAITAAGRTAALAAGGGWLALAFLALFMQQRRRTALLQQRSREELEAVLQQHAQELRTAQDGIVEAARQADAGLSRSLEHLPQGVVIIDADLRLVAWNSRYMDLFRFPPDLIHVGRPIEDVFRYNARRGLLGPGPVEDAIQRRLDHLRSGKPHMRESEKDDGVVLEIRGNPLPDGGFVTSYADITSYKNAARELRSLADALERRVEERTRALAAATQAAENANRYKTRFVASAVHDLLQPLNAARMFVSALRGRLHDDEARRIADHVDNALTAQDAILNSLLDIARLESGTLPTRVRDFALAPLLETLAREFGMLAEERGLSLACVPTGAIVRSDEALLRRILQNFLSNAIRYTPRGRVLLGVRRRGGQVRIEVHDQGPGIPESLQSEIFEEFRRLNDGVVNDRGAGLGLAIVERIGRVLGHRIGLRSRLGHGSVFWVEVPRGVANAATTQASPVLDDIDDGSPLRGRRVWCVDDDPRVCEATRALLLRWECDVDLASGPDDAVAAAVRDQAPDLLLLDVRLGDTDGPTLYARLCERWGHAPPVILVTAERDEALRALALERGWGFLAKPVKPAALRALMTQLHVRRAR